MSNLARQMIEQHARGFRELGAPMVMYDFVLNYGEEWQYVLHADKQGTPNECFCNAARLAVMSLHDDYVYCEGYTASADFAIPLLHAWVLDEFGTVIETTLTRERTKALHYFGVRYQRDFVLEQMRRYEVFGILGGTPQQAMHLIDLPVHDWNDNREWEDDT